MSVIEMDSKIKELRELCRMADELAAEIDALQDSIKAEMTARNVDTLAGSNWRVTWKNVTSNPSGYFGTEKGPPRCGRAVHEADHRLPVRAGVKKPAIPAGQSCG